MHSDLHVLRPTSILTALTVVLSLPACSSEKNHAERMAASERGQNGACINHCYDDPPIEEVDCEAAEAGVEFYPKPIWDFEGDLGSNMYTYTDKTSWYLVPHGWEPEAESVVRCRNELPSPALHLRGGPFIEWGGGLGRDMKCLNGSTLVGEIKPERNETSLGIVGRTVTTGENPYFGPDRACGEAPPLGGACEDTDSLAQSACPERDRQAIAQGTPVGAGEEEFMLGMTLDLSEWEGVSFWARRSLNSQAGIRLAVGDKHTDDDLAYLQYHINPDSEPFCRRKKECGAETADICRNGRPCTQFRFPDGGGVVTCTVQTDCTGAGKDYGMCNKELGAAQGLPEGWGFCEAKTCTIPGDCLSGICTDGLCAQYGSYCYDPATDPPPHSIRPPRVVYAECGEDADCRNSKPCTVWDAETPDDRADDRRLCWDPAVDPPPHVAGYTVCDADRPCANGRPCTTWNAGTPDDPSDDVKQCYDPSWEYPPLRRCDVVPCPSGVPCSTWDARTPNDPGDDERLCWDPRYDLVPDDREVLHQSCGDYQCDRFYEPFQSYDAEFTGRPCTPHAFHGSIVEAHCFEPGVDPDPAEGLDVCGDHWMAPVYLSTEWRFYKVPFKTLLQQGWAKEFFEFDLTSVAIVRFTWDRGWVDYYIDDVRFYRHKR